MASPNDPVFFLLHSNIDRLWARWQEAHGTDSYQPASGVEHNSLHDVMRPFEQTGESPTAADVADIRALGYSYSAAATRSRARIVRWLLCRPRGRERSHVT
jgi:tyrosinase